MLCKKMNILYGEFMAQPPHHQALHIAFERVLLEIEDVDRWDAENRKALSPGSK